MKEIEKKNPPHQIAKSMTFISSWSLNYCFHVPLFELSRNWFFFLANEIYVLKETLKCNCLLYLVKKKSMFLFIHEHLTKIYL